jgi:hypothetical protein
MSSSECFDRFYHCFFFKFLKPDLSMFAYFCQTHATHPRSPSSSALAAGSTCHVDCWSSTHNGHAPPFLAVHNGEWGLRCLICGGVLPVMALSSTRRRLRRSQPCLHCWRLVLDVFLLCVLCIPSVSPVQYIAKILLEFLLA